MEPVRTIMPTTPRGISYEEIAPPELTIGRDGLTGKRVFKIRWEDVDAFAVECFPASVQTSGGNIVPNMLIFPGKPYLIVQNVAFTGFDQENPGDPDAAGVATCPSGARVEISYATSELQQSGSNNNEPDFEEGPLIYTAAVQVGGDYFNLPAHSLKWQGDNPDNGDDNQTEDLNAAKLIPTMEYVITCHRMPEYPLEIIKDKIGRINSEYDKNFNAEPETLLFVGSSATRRVTSDGAEAWEVEYRFSHRVVTWLDRPDIYDPLVTYPTLHAGWNHFIDPRDGKWKKLMTKSNDFIYNTTENFDALFFPDQDAEYSSSSSLGMLPVPIAGGKGFF